MHKLPHQILNANSWTSSRRQTRPNNWILWNNARFYIESNDILPNIYFVMLITVSTFLTAMLTNKILATWVMKIRDFLGSYMVSSKSERVGCYFWVNYYLTFIELTRFGRAFLKSAIKNIKSINIDLENEIYAAGYMMFKKVFFYSSTMLLRHTIRFQVQSG